MEYLRLKKNTDFQRLFKKGKRAYSQYLTVIYCPVAEKKGGKTVMGIALSKKHGKAVKRNRIKRLIRAAFANNLDKLKGCYSLIVMPKVCESYAYTDIEKSLKTCFGRMDG